MGKTNINLSFEDRLILHDDSGSMVHVFGEGYFIVDELGNEIGGFYNIAEYNRLTEKFRYRDLLTEKLKKIHEKVFSFGENNVLSINGKKVENIYWNLPKDMNEVELYFDVISKEIMPNFPSQ